MLQELKRDSVVNGGAELARGEGREGERGERTDVAFLSPRP